MKTLLSFLFLSISLCSFSQEGFTRADTLRGSITPERAWWNVTYYDLDVKVNPSETSISGSNVITYEVLESFQVMQIDLQSPMKIDNIIQDGENISFTSDGNAHFLELKKPQIRNEKNKIEIHFSGKPRIAKRPP